MRSSVLVLVSITLGVTPAAAEIDNEKADKLFERAVALRDTNPGEACKLFEEALGYNPQAIGTRLNVALCEEKAGHIASAVEHLKEVIDRAKAQRLAEFERVADEKLALLLPDLSYLTIKLAEQPPDTTLLIDDRVIPLDKLVDRAIDRGDRTIVVTAPGRIAYRQTLRIERRERRTLAIPKLAVIKSARATIGKITVAAGAATVVTGVVVGLVARSRYNAARDNCTDGATGPLCSAQDASTIDSARTLGNVGTVVTIVGLSAAAVGGVLWWRAPSPERQTGLSYLGPQAGPGEVGVVAAGRF